MVSCQYLEV